MSTTQTDVVTHRRACHLCEAICGLVIKVRNNDILSIKGDPDDPLSRGHICPKAVALKDIQNDPDRLRQPMRRMRNEGDGQRWEPIAWDEAFDLVAERLVSTRQAYGDHALAVYLGNPSVHNYGILTHQGALFSYLKTNNRYSATSVDQLPHHLVSLWLYGHKDLLPVPDIDRTDYFLMLGANPVASNGSIWTVPDVTKRIDELRQRGGKLVVIDPRRTETAERASAHHPIRPGTDMLFLCALIHTLFDENLAQSGRLSPFVDGVETVRKALDGFSPEAVAASTGIAASTVRQIAREFAAAGSAVCYGRMGVSTQAFGTLNHWLVQLVNILTGNLDHPGGAMFTRPAVNDFAKTRPGRFARFTSRVSGKPEFGGELPVAVLAEEMLTPGEGQIKALFTCAGNPVLSTPNGRQLDRALAGLEFMVSLDPYINETTRHADVILPPTAPLEHDHYDLAFHTLAVRNTARFNEAVFDKPEGTLHDWEIFSELGRRVAAQLGIEAREQIAPDVMIDRLLQAGNYSAGAGHDAALDLDKLRQHPSGIDLGPLQPALPERLIGDQGSINIALEPCLADLERARAAINTQADLMLFGRRHVRSNNSWMHNYQRLVKGKPRSELLMHPQDLHERGLDDGQLVQIKSRVGAERVRVCASDAVMPGTVCLPHGFGHQRDGVRLSVASQLDGISFNDLTDDQAIDPLSGNAVLNGTPVSVSALDDPATHESGKHTAAATA